mgnify:CR=1 FL=1
MATVKALFEGEGAVSREAFAAFLTEFCSCLSLAEYPAFLAAFEGYVTIERPERMARIKARVLHEEGPEAAARWC